jgi:hypothetical protein
MTSAMPPMGAGVDSIRLNFRMAGDSGTFQSPM